MKYKLETLDLHGIYHKEAEILIDHFIKHYIDKMGVGCFETRVRQATQIILDKTSLGYPFLSMAQYLSYD